MESRSHAIAAGLFAIILGAGVVLALWWFSDKREATRELVLVTSSSVNGLNPQATVRYRGIVAGKVAGIGLDPGNPRDVLVTVRIRADLPITQGTRARLATQGVTGLAFIALDDSGENAAPLAGDPPRIRLAPGLIDEVSAASLQTLTRVRELAERLAGEAHPANRDVPIFMAHGVADPVIPHDFARRSADQLTAAGYPLAWKTYRMEHSLCLEEVRDIEDWLATVLAA